MSFFDRRTRRGLPVAAGSGSAPEAAGALPATEGAPVGASAAAAPTVVTSAGQAVEAMVSTLSGHLALPLRSTLEGLHHSPCEE